MFKAPLFLAAFAIAGAVVFADESATDKAKATGRDAKRSAKRAVHHLQEAVCAEGDAKCLAKKAKHRGEEATEYVKDKVQ